MNRPIGRRALLRGGVAISVWLAAPRVRACEFWSTHLRIYLPRARATAEGDTTAALYMVFDQVLATGRLIGVDTPVASGAEMGGPGAGPIVDFLIPEGRESVLYEDGRFIRLVGLKHPLELGLSYPLTLIFEKGGSVKADIDIDRTRDG
ncbi:MAG: copper chaperone PCu(A)C [Caldimonas sp.]